MARNYIQPRHHRRVPAASSPSTTTGSMEILPISPLVGPDAASAYPPSPSPGFQSQVSPVQQGRAHGPAAYQSLAPESSYTPCRAPVGGQLDLSTTVATPSRHSPMAPRLNTDPFRPIEPDQSQLDGPTDGFFPPLGPASASTRAQNEQPVAGTKSRRTLRHLFM